MRVLLTGARGYIGARLSEILRKQGAEVTTLDGWRLGQPVPALGPVDAIIHLAHDWHSADVNQRGTELLLQAARARGVKRFVFVSSMSARSDAPNRYGRVKAAVEGLLQAPGELAARVGLVYGGPPQGLYGTMMRLTRLPVLPMIDAGQKIQPIHLDEVCDGLIRMATEPTLTKPVYRLASNQPMTFGAFLGVLGRACHGRAPLLLPIPSSLALIAADLSAKVPLLPTVDRERVLGLAGIRVQDSAADLAELDLELAPVLSRRRLTHEGTVLLRYCTGAKPNPMTVRLYVRTLAALGEATPIDLPRWIRLGDKPGSPLRRRLAIAARIAEAGREPVDRFHMVQPEGRLAVLVKLAGLMMIEAPLLALRWLRR
jgi:nucleoside-diphosphate-sugar epimerase